MRRWIILLSCSLLLSACGFHLRGMIDIPKWLNNVAVVMQQDDKQFASILKAHLDRYHIRVNPDPAQAKYWLIINRVSRQEQIISVGASTNPRQYSLILTVEFMLQTRKGDMIKSPRTIYVTRQLTVNNDRILGSNYEENLFISEMKQDAVIQIMNQLSHQDPVR